VEAQSPVRTVSTLCKRHVSGNSTQPEIYVRRNWPHLIYQTLSFMYVFLENQFTCLKRYIFFSMTQQPLVGHGLLIIESARSHSDTPQSVGLLWTSDQPVAETSYLITHNTHKRQAPMFPVGFEPASPASERPQTHALDRAATGTG